MNFSKVLCFYFVFLSFTIFANSGKDLITCKIEQDTFRQFCDVVEDTLVSEVYIPSSMEINGVSFNTYDLIKNGFIETPDGKATIPFKGFDPRLRISVDWKDLEKCFASSLWKDKIAIYSVNDGDELHFLDQIVKGPKNYEIDLSVLRNSDFEPLNYSLLGSQIQILTKFTFRNLDKVQNKNLAFQRIPKHCQMMLSDAHLGFDSPAIMNDLKHLRVHIDTTRSYLTKAYILHNHLLDRISGAQCSVYNLAQTLKRLEDLETKSPLDELSLGSKTAITEALNRAQEIGGFSTCSHSSGLWDYFSDQVNQENFARTCKNLDKKNLAVSTDTFMSGDKIINQEGWNNATDYLEKKETLKRLLNVAWALVAVGKYEIEKQKELNWLLDAFIYHDLF